VDASERLIAKAALARPDVAVEAWRTWRDTFEIATATGLLTWAGGYIYRNLNEAGVHDPYLAGIHRYNFISNNRRLIAAVPVIRALAERWPLAPLKSFGMSREIYSRGLRPLADFDFWVPARHVAAVRSLLEERGFAPNIGVDEFEFAHRVLPQRGSWNHLDPSGVDLDIHWRAFDHLDVDENERIVRRFSTSADSEFGRVLLPSSEFATVLLGYHHQLEPANSATLMFDLHHLLGSVDSDEVLRVAAATRMERDLAAALAYIREILGDDARPEVAGLQRRLAPFARSRPRRDEVVLASKIGERLPESAGETGYLRRPRWYRVWWWLGRPGWLERALIATGGIARPGPGDVASSPGSSFPLTTGAIAGGWHYLYPGAGFRWANAPDARVVFEDSEDADGLVVEVDPKSWGISPLEGFDVFANGRPLGSVEKVDGVVVFPLPGGGRRIEVSLRVADQRRFRDPGMHLNWYRMLAPVVRLDLVNRKSAAAHSGPGKES
jgi:hypothetical protein